MATITDEKFVERNLTVVLVVGRSERILGYGISDDFFPIPNGNVHVIDNSVKEPVSMSFELNLDTDEIEKLREFFRPKPSVHDLAKLAADLNRVQASIKAAERFGQMDSIPVPKKYQRNRHQR